MFLMFFCQFFISFLNFFHFVFHFCFFCFLIFFIDFFDFFIFLDVSPFFLILFFLFSGVHFFLGFKCLKIIWLFSGGTPLGFRFLFFPFVFPSFFPFFHVSFFHMITDNGTRATKNRFVGMQLNTMKRCQWRTQRSCSNTHTKLSPYSLRFGIAHCSKMKAVMEEWRAAIASASPRVAAFGNSLNLL